MTSQLDYILRSLSKIHHKRFEHFIVNRIYHRLNDPDLEFICQQLVLRPDGKRALTDLYLPQLRIHLEINEPFHLGTQEADRNREADIITVTGHTIKTIEVAGKNLQQIEAEADRFVDLIRNGKNQLVEKDQFEAWNFDQRYDPERHKKAGFIDARDQVLFRYQRDVLRCFGYAGGHFQKGIWKFTWENKHRIVWFPRLWQHGSWKNELSPDGNYIFEDSGDQEITGYRIPDAPDFTDQRVVFAKWKNPLGQFIYRFTGVFEKCSARSTGKITAFRKVSDRFILNLAP